MEEWRIPAGRRQRGVFGRPRSAQFEVNSETYIELLTANRATSGQTPAAEAGRAIDMGESRCG